MRAAIILAAATMLAGCSTLDGVLVNRVACTLDRQQGAFISWYGPIGISAKIADSDAKVMCPESVPVLLQITPRSASSGCRDSGSCGGWEHVSPGASTARAAR